MNRFLLQDRFGYFWNDSPFFAGSLEYSMGLTEKECRARANRGDVWAQRAVNQADLDDEHGLYEAALAVA